MKIEIEIAGPELDELRYIVAEINKTNASDARNESRQPPPPLTEQAYIEPIVLNHLRGRVEKIYQRAVRRMNSAELQDKLGPVNNVR